MNIIAGRPYANSPVASNTTIGQIDVKDPLGLLSKAAAGTSSSMDGAAADHLPGSGSAQPGHEPTSCSVISESIDTPDKKVRGVLAAQDTLGLLSRGSSSPNASAGTSPTSWQPSLANTSTLSSKLRSNPLLLNQSTTSSTTEETKLNTSLLCTRQTNAYSMDMDKRRKKGKVRSA